MNGRETIALAVFAALACNAEVPESEAGSVVVAASEDAVPGHTAPSFEPAEAATVGFASLPSSSADFPPLLQDTARTVTRRLWAEADLGSVSPDGRYASITDWDTGDLAIRDLETGEIRYLTHNTWSWEPGFADGHLISWDGEWVAFDWFEFGERGGYKLGVVPTTGGDPRFIAGPTGWIKASDWSHDGAFVLALREEGLKRELLMISAEDGSAEVLKTFHDSGFPRGAKFSPDGGFVAYALDKPGDGSDWDIYAIDLATGREQVLVQNPAFDALLGWAPDGNHILFQSDRGGTPGAWLLPVSEAHATGNPWLVKPDLWRAQALRFGEGGRFFYTVETGKKDVFVAAFDSEAKTLVGSATPMISRSLGDGGIPLWSPDGTHLAYAVQTDPVRWSPRSIVIQSLETGAIKELGLDVSGTPHPVSWTPDGRGIFFIMYNLNDPEIRVALYRVDIQTSDEEIIFEFGHDHDLLGLRLSPDARTLFVAGAGPPWEDPANRAGNESQLRSYKLVRMNLETEAFTELFQTPPGGPGMIRGLRPSPDGQTLAFGYCPPGGPDRLVLLPSQGGEIREIAEGCFTEIAWMPSGDGLLAYGSSDEEAESFEVFYVDLAGGGVHPIGIFGEDLSLRIDVHPDGQRIAYNSTSGTTGTELWVMENFLPGSGGVGGIRPLGEGR